jgi:penicillin G amidase
MKTLKKVLYGLLIIIVITLIAGLIFIRHISHKGLPEYSGTLDLKGIKEEVTVIRDEYAIPHIYAKNEEDLYTAVGYVMAQDRLWQMDLVRRATLGRLSEIFGKEFIETDLLLRALHYPDKSKEILAFADSVHLKALKSFCNGINEYIEKAGTRLPLEFSILGYKPEPFEPISCANLIGYMCWDQATGWEQIVLDQIRLKVGDSLYRELIPDTTFGKTQVYPLYTKDSLQFQIQSSLLKANDLLEGLGLHVFHASNNWAVNGKRSSTGKPILCNDAHMSLSIPGIWYQMHQIIPGKLDVSGVVIPGEPFIIMGHNQRIAWGLTTVDVDNIDFYEEKIKDDDSLQYLYNNEWKKMEVRKEVINIKGGAKVERENRFTHRGPVISNFKGIPQKIVTMHWSGYETSNLFRSFYLIDRAGDWKEFKDALSTYKTLCSNIVYADVEGNIGLYCAAGIPVRNRDNEKIILPGWTDKYDWKGFVPFENLPHSYNPGNGYVSSANNKTAGDDYPYFIGAWPDLSSRIDRIREMIEQKPVLSPEDMKVIQNDQHSVLARNMNIKIIELLSSVNDLSKDEKTAFEILKKWKGGLMSKDLAAPAVFETFYFKLSDNLLKDEIDTALYSSYFNEWMLRFAIVNIWNNPASGWWDDITTDKKESMTDIVRRTLSNSVEFLTSNFGTDTAKWKLGNFHALSLEHPLGTINILNKIFHLNRGPLEVGGSTYTISRYSYSFNEPFKCNFGSSQRHIFNVADWDASSTVIPTGNSGEPASNFYCDQTQMYVNGQYHGEYFSDDSVKKHEKFKLILK